MLQPAHSYDIRARESPQIWYWNLPDYLPVVFLISGWASPLSYQCKRVRASESDLLLLGSDRFFDCHVSKSNRVIFRGYWKWAMWCYLVKKEDIPLPTWDKKTPPTPTWPTKPPTNPLNHTPPLSPSPPISRYVSILVELTRLEGTRHGKLIAGQMLDVAIRVQTIRPFAVSQMALLLENAHLIVANVTNVGRHGMSEVSVDVAVVVTAAIWRSCWKTHIWSTLMSPMWVDTACPRWG